MLSVNPTSELLVGVALAVAGFVLLVVGGATCSGCAGASPAGAIAADVVRLDRDACELVHDLGGPTVTALCPVGGQDAGEGAPRVAVEVARDAYFGSVWIGCAGDGGHD